VSGVSLLATPHGIGQMSIQEVDHMMRIAGRIVRQEVHVGGGRQQPE
jgi:hypothetical protein